MAAIEDVPIEYWTKLSQKKIFFAHAELGDQIIDGVKAIVTKYDCINLNIVETTDPAAFDRPIFAHAKIGKCTNPDSKIGDFKNALDNGIGKRADIASLKFCYMDVIWQSDGQIVFDNYQEMIKELKNRDPRLKFLHVTVPICSRPRKNKKILRESTKLLAGRPSIFDDNLRRQQYNTLLRSAYSQTESVFNLALAESIDPDGFSWYTTTRGVERVLAKAPQYSVGIAHFTKEGRRKVAEQLLIALARMANDI